MDSLLKSLNLIPSKKALKEQLVVLGLLIATLAITLPVKVFLLNLNLE